ncbi:MAG: histidinol dehydrogenase [Selenomonadaceae bacterium]|nr:histidinol dehydrogenase [Selenomonadaceae bacterium]
MKIINSAEIGRSEIEKLLQKKPFDEVELPPKIRDFNKKIFGKDLTAAELVKKIVDDVRHNGDAAVIDYTKKFDNVEICAENFLVTDAEISNAESQVDAKVIESLQRAAKNIFSYHLEQLPKSWMTYRGKNSILGQSIIPLERVGVYIPGGLAAYPSSVLMNVIPAKVAGVDEIIMCVPSKGGKINPYVLMAAKIAGADKIFKIGGAQAVAAMAFGTATIPRVNKITGPGNIFVTLAKKEVYGHCDIDMLAGPSEILIIADESANPAYAAADMLSQAEHDPLACSIVITTDLNLAEKISAQVTTQLEKLPRREIAAASIENNGLIIAAKNLDDAIDFANISAPEHLELLTKNPFELLPKIKNAGAIFAGENSPEPLGDYFAGPNHVLPTGGTAKFYSVLNVETFLKRTSLISYTRQDLLNVADDIINLAEVEGLSAHANAVELRKNFSD